MEEPREWLDEHPFDLSQCIDCGEWTDIEPDYTIDDTPDGVLCSECD